MGGVLAPTYVIGLAALTAAEHDESPTVQPTNLLSAEVAALWFAAPGAQPCASNWESICEKLVGPYQSTAA